MITELSQQTIAEYASDALTTQKPEGTDYSQGVRVGRTIPAKWWNWLFNAVTKRLIQSNADAQDMLTEMQNTVTDAGLTLDGTDDTQLSQAIDIKADTRIDEFVDAKRADTLRLWESKKPREMFNFVARGRNGLPVYYLQAIGPYLYPSGYKKASAQRMFEVNGVYFAAGQTTLILAYQYALIYSVDLVNWFSASPFKGRVSDAEDPEAYFEYGVVYFKNMWFARTVERKTVNTYGYYTVRIRRSYDLANWEEVFTNSRGPLASFANRGMIVAFDDALYFSDVNGDLYKITASAQGITCTATGASGIDTGWSGWTAFNARNISDEAVIINNYLLNRTTGAMTNIVAAGFNTIKFCISVSFGNGTGAVGGASSASDSNYNLAYYARALYMVHSDGTVDSLLADAQQYEYYILGAFDNMLIRRDRTLALVSSLAFSYDGTNFSPLPYEGNNYMWPVCKIGSTIICTFGNNKLYSIENALSSNIEDYTLINSSLPSYVSMNLGGLYTQTMFYSAYDKALVVPGAASFDGGKTWVQCTVTTTRETYSFSGPSQGINKYGKRISFCGRNATSTYEDEVEVAETHPCVNRVLGQTLYLQ